MLHYIKIREAVKNLVFAIRAAFPQLDSKTLLSSLSYARVQP